MNPEVKAAWVAALRSGEYKQGTGQLRNSKGEYCCLGVLCDLAVKAGAARFIDDSPGGTFSFNMEPGGGNRHAGENGYLMPLGAYKWMGYDREPGVGSDGNVYVTVDGNVETLSGLNDSGESFETIAKIIEEQL